MKILIVEDDAEVRLVAVEAVAEAGYEAIKAAGAEEALLLLERTRDVGILFSDVRMPGTMDGLALAKLVHSRWPTIRILLTSADARLDEADVPNDWRFLAKPYRIASLHEKLDELQTSLG